MIIEGLTVLRTGVRKCQVVIVNDRILEVNSDPSDFKVADIVLKDSWVLAPGLIDAQINGGFGKEFKTDEDSVSHVSSRIVRYGVTGFVPTVTTKAVDSYEAHLGALERDVTFASGARVFGIHVEGPALTPAKRGAHPAEMLVAPQDLDIDTVVSPLVRVVTLAPELPGGWDLARLLAQRGVRVGVGHSLASYDDVVANFEADQMHIVHTFNAMSELTARSPGIVGAALDRSDYWASVIADLIHVHAASLRILREARGGSAKIFGVSDGSAVLGLPNGVHAIGSRSIEKRDDRAVLADTETLVGSVLTMNVAVRNAWRVWGCDLAEAVAFASYNAAEYLGMSDDLGSIEPGKLADLCVMDQEFNVMLTIVGGQIAFDADHDET